MLTENAKFSASDLSHPGVQCYLPTKLNHKAVFETSFNLKGGA